MSKRFVLCVLSQLRDRALPYCFSFEDMDVDTALGNGHGSYEGLQTNVAPVECLIDLGNRAYRKDPASEPISKIVYLRSKECRDEVIVTGSLKERSTTTEEHFKEEVYCYYYDHLPDGVEPIDYEDLFSAVDYDPSKPESNLQAVIDALGSDDTIVDVETTGGFRDAINLLTLAIEVLQLQPQSSESICRPRLGTTVYAQVTESPDYQQGLPGRGNISVQNDIYSLSNLINAVNSFTKYGKAEELCSYFESEGTTASKKLRDLLKAMQEFSDKLSLCQTNGLAMTVQQIHSKLENLENSNSTSPMIHGEMLFRSLIPSIRRSFVPTRSSLMDSEMKRLDTHIMAAEIQDAAIAMQTIETIRWCLERQMVQQALSLFEENIPECLYQLRLIGTSEDNARELVRCIFPGKDNAKNRSDSFDTYQLARDLRFVKQRSPKLEKFDFYRLESYLLACHPRHYYKGIDENEIKSDNMLFSEMIVYYYYIKSIRNKIVHASSSKKPNDIAREFKILFNKDCFTYASSANSSPRKMVSCIKSDINTGLDLIIRCYKQSAEPLNVPLLELP